MDCDTFHISIEVFSLIPSAVNLKIIDDSCSNCEKEFSIDLKPALTHEQLDARILRDFSENTNKNFIKKSVYPIDKSRYVSIIK